MPSLSSDDKDKEFQWDKMDELIRLNEKALPTAEEDDSFPFRTWLDLAACEDLPYTSFKLEHKREDKHLDLNRCFSKTRLRDSLRSRIQG